MTKLPIAGEIKEKTKKPDRIGKRAAILMMSVLVWVWGFDFIAAKKTLEVLPMMPMLFLKLLVGTVLIVIIKLFIDRRFLISRKDLLYLVLCVIFGEIFYYVFEYNAMSYLPVSLVSVILAFVPAISILIEKVILKRKVTKIMVFGIAGSIFGVALVIGVDFSELFQGKLYGYLLAFGGVFSWNLYNFFTVELHKRYNSLTVIYVQLLGGVLFLAPLGLHQMPPPEVFTPVVIGGVLYIGVLVSGVGALIFVRVLHVLGPTSAAMFSNFLPITTTFFGWMFLSETISPLQMVGGVIIITAACIIIREKSKVENC